MVSKKTLLENLILAENRLTSFCDTPNAKGEVIAPDSMERVYLRQIRNTIEAAGGHTTETREAQEQERENACEDAFNKRHAIYD